MYIKTIILQGFKSFHDRTVIDLLSPGVNVIIGHNGAGKSTILDGLQFALTDRYATLSVDDRVALFSRASNLGQLTQCAIVEVHLDNSNNEIQLNNDYIPKPSSQSNIPPNTIIIRRKLTRDKDEYTINNIVIPRADLASLLQPFGLGSNTHSFAEQNSISKLLTMGDYGRLELLMQAAGTTQYDQKRLESLKIMNSSDKELQDVDLLLSTLNIRLVQLQKERSKLITYEYLLCRKRTVDIEIYDRLIKSIDAELAQLRLEQSTLLKESAKPLTRNKPKKVNAKKRKTRSVLNPGPGSESDSDSDDEIDDDDQSSDLDDTIDDGATIIDIEEVRQTLLMRRQFESKLAELLQQQDDDIRLRDKLNNQLQSLKTTISNYDRELTTLKDEYNITSGEIVEIKQSIDEFNDLINKTQLDYDSVVQSTTDLDLELQLYQERKLILLSKNIPTTTTTTTKSKNSDVLSVDATEPTPITTMLPHLQHELELYDEQLDEKYHEILNLQKTTSQLHTTINITNVNELNEIELKLAELNTRLDQVRAKLQTDNKLTDTIRTEVDLWAQTITDVEQRKSIALNLLLQTHNVNSFNGGRAGTGNNNNNDQRGNRKNTNTDNTTKRHQFGNREALLEVEELLSKYQIWSHLKKNADARRAEEISHQQWLRTHGQKNNDDEHDVNKNKSSPPEPEFPLLLTPLDLNYNPDTGEYLFDGKEDLSWVEGVYGPLCTLLSWPPSLDRALSAIFGPRLFYVIVDTPQTAMKLHSYLHHGNLTIVPVTVLQGYQPVTRTTRQFQGKDIVIHHIPQDTHKTDRVEHVDIIPLLQQLTMRYNQLRVEYKDEVNNNSQRFDLESLDNDHDDSTDDVKPSKFITLTRKTDLKYYHIKFALRTMINNCVAVRAQNIGLQINAVYPHLTCVTMATGTIVGKLGEISGGYAKPTSIVRNESITQYIELRDDFVEKSTHYRQLTNVYGGKLAQRRTDTEAVEKLLLRTSKLTLQRKKIETDSIEKHHELHHLETQVAQLQSDYNVISTKLNFTRCKLQLYGLGDDFDDDTNHTTTNNNQTNAKDKNNPSTSNKRQYKYKTHNKKLVTTAINQSKPSSSMDDGEGNDISQYNDFGRTGNNQNNNDNQHMELTQMTKIITEILTYTEVTALDTKLNTLRQSKSNSTQLLNQYLFTLSTTKENLYSNFYKRLEQLNLTRSDYAFQIQQLEESIRRAQGDYLATKSLVKNAIQRGLLSQEQYQDASQNITSLDIELARMGLDPTSFQKTESLSDQDDGDNYQQSKTKKTQHIDIDAILSRLAGINDGVTTLGMLKQQSRGGAIGGILVLNETKGKLTALAMKIQTLLLQRSEYQQKVQILTVELSSTILYQLLDGVEIDMDQLAQQFGLSSSTSSTRKSKKTKKSTQSNKSLMGDDDTDNDADDDDQTSDSDSDKSNSEDEGDTNKSKKSQSSTNSSKPVSKNPQLDKIYNLVTRRHPRNPSKVTYCLQLIDDKNLHALFQGENLPSLSLPNLHQLSHLLIQSSNDYSRHTNRDGALLYLTLKDQYTDLITRRKELTNARKHLIVLIMALDKRKKETILATFEQLNIHFKDILSQLWTSIQGELVLYSVGDTSIDNGSDHKKTPNKKKKRKMGDDDDDDDNDESSDDNELDDHAENSSADDTDTTAVDENVKNYFNFQHRLSTLTDAEITAILQQTTTSKISKSCGFSGIGVVLTNPHTQQQLRLASMSGGQGSQIAIALLLAIQRVVNASCCILDEPDANMDLEFTENLFMSLYKHSHSPIQVNNITNTSNNSNIINNFRLQTSTQTILTSFHTELAIKKANVIYQVSLQLGHPKVTRTVGQPLPNQNPGTELNKQNVNNRNENIHPNVAQNKPQKVSNKFANSNAMNTSRSTRMALDDDDDDDYN